MTACNYDETATELDDSCDYESCADCCGVANGDGTTCDGLCGACSDDTSCLDECGVANGDNSSCLDFCGVPNGDNACCTELMTLTSSDASCELNNGTVTASITDCEMTSTNTESFEQMSAVIDAIQSYYDISLIMSDPMFSCIVSFDIMELAYTLQTELSNLGDYPESMMMYAMDIEMLAMEMEMSGCVFGDFFMAMDMLFMIQSIADMFESELNTLIEESLESACTVTWTNEAGEVVGSGMELSGLSAGTYSAFMSHSNGCSDTQTVQVQTECLGCMDDTACNYNENANVSDDSCTFAETGYDCQGLCLNDENNNGICDEFEVSGCTDESAYNYDPVAVVDDGSCTAFVYGCTDSEAYNYNSFANTDDNSCIEYIYGCTDESAINYNDIANTDDESCIPFIYGCTYDDMYNYNPQANTDDGSCIPFIYGCTDQNSLNFNNNANSDDGSCIEIVQGCTYANAYNFNSSANTDDGSCDFGPWGVENTDCNMTILLPENMIIDNLNNEINYPIWIGVTDEDGNVYGSTLFDGNTTSIAVWGEEENLNNGMEVGETLNWIIMIDGENTPVIASYEFGSSLYGCNDLASVSSITTNLEITQDIELNNGWNLWSSYINLEQTSMEEIFSDITDDLIICKDENGNVYWPAFGLNNIETVSIGKGFQAKMSSETILSVSGLAVENNTPFAIPAGWSIIGYLNQSPSSVESMMEEGWIQIESANLVIMKDENGNVYWPEFGLDNIMNMNPGEGYQVKTNSSANFAFPSADGGRLAYTESLKTVHYDLAENTGSNMTIGLPLTSWDVMPAIGDEIAAYDESGRLIGSTLFTGENIALTVWGDDVTTSAKDGLAIGEKVNFKLWNSDVNNESTIVVTKWDAGSDAYAMDGISIASNIIVSGSTPTDAYKLYQNVPNPFNGTTTIKFYVPQSAEVTIGVYNMLGEYVAEVTEDIFNAGKHEVIFDASNLGQGNYFVRMPSDNFTETKNINILK